MSSDQCDADGIANRRWSHLVNGIGHVFRSAWRGRIRWQSLVAYIVLYGVLVLGVLAMLKLIFKDAVNSETPFTEKQADRLRFIAFLALMFALLEFAFTLGVTFEVVPRIGYDVIVNRGSTEPVISINVGVLVFSAIMYSLSAIFRYAALLQQLSDETV